MRLILLGAPGSGKGTQSQRLVQQKNMIQLSTGDLLRAAVKNESELGLKAKSFMSQGQLVPDELVIDLIREKLGEEKSNLNIIFDGFPRTVAQAEALDSLLSEMNAPLDHVVYLRVPEADLIKRITGRRSCADCGAAYHLVFSPTKEDGICDQCGSKNIIQRDDDKIEVVEKRFRAYQAQTLPLVEFYSDQGLLAEIEGTGDPDSIYERLEAAIS